MITIEKIQSAEEQVAGVQQALGVVQSGLERVETVAVAAKKAKRHCGRPIKVVLGLVGLSVLVLVVARLMRKSSQSVPTQTDPVTGTRRDALDADVPRPFQDV